MGETSSLNTCAAYYEKIICLNISKSFKAALQSLFELK